MPHRPSSLRGSYVAWRNFSRVEGVGLGVAIPVVMSFALGEPSGPLLGRLKDWMARNNAVIMAVLLLVIGVELIGDAIAGFS